MGIFDAAKGALSSVVSTAKAELDASKYRTSVMYDFSIVSKARFYVYESNKSENFELTKILPVQINPSLINNESEVEGQTLKGALMHSGDDDTKNDRPGKSVNKEFRVTLPFDVFDEYMAATVNDSLPPINATGAVSIDDEHSIWTPLVDAAKTPDKYRVRFVWGSVSEFGKITNLSQKINCYSRWGIPIKGELSITITATNDPTEEKLKDIVSEAYGANKALMSAALVASEALR